MLPLTPLELLFKEWYYISGGDTSSSAEELEQCLADHSYFVTDILKAANACTSIEQRKQFCATHGFPGVSDDEYHWVLERFSLFKDYYHQKSSTTFHSSAVSSSYYTSSCDANLTYHDRYCNILPHTHDFFEIVFLVCGECSHMVGGSTFNMYSGDVVIVPPHTMHQLMSYDDQNITFNMHISTHNFEQNFLELLNAKNLLGAFFRKTLYSPDSSQPWFLIKTEDYFLGDNLLATIYDESKSSHVYKHEMLNSYVRLLFLYLMEHYSDTMFSSIEKEDNPVVIMEIMNYIRQHYNTVTTDELCMRFNYSERHLYRLLIKYTGSSLSNLRRNLRLQRAKQLLSNTALSVEQIASNIGYTSTNHFYTDFRKETGVTPLTYRKRVLLPD
jgi:AraC family cel operon transcriptional repressor